MVWLLAVGEGASAGWWPAQSSWAKISYLWLPQGSTNHWEGKQRNNMESFERDEEQGLYGQRWLRSTFMKSHFFLFMTCSIQKYSKDFLIAETADANVYSRCVMWLSELHGDLVMKHISLHFKVRLSFISPWMKSVAHFLNTAMIHLCHELEWALSQ